SRTGGLQKPSIVNVSQIVMIGRPFLNGRIGRVGPQVLGQIDQGCALSSHWRLVVGSVRARTLLRPPFLSPIRTNVTEEPNHAYGDSKRGKARLGGHHRGRPTGARSHSASKAKCGGGDVDGRIRAPRQPERGRVPALQRPRRRQGTEGRYDGRGTAG